ncbi:MAG: (d)CMP kinase [Thermoanaerobaculia bacterium]
MAVTIVAIDGPSGVGKSTTSRRVAEVLDLPHIDTGAMYRAMALKARRAGVPLTDEDRLEGIAASTAIELEGSGNAQRVLLDGEDVSTDIRTPEISMAASRISAVPAVRRVLVQLQQQIGRRSGGVLEGRDIGTKVFPETSHKFFLTARPEVRAARRLTDLQNQGVAQSLEQVLLEMDTRDRRDTTRADSPLTWDETYTVLDTSQMTIDQVVAAIVEQVRGSIRGPS